MQNSTTPPKFVPQRVSDQQKIFNSQHHNACCSFAGQTNMSCSLSYQRCVLLASCCKAKAPSSTAIGKLESTLSFMYRAVLPDRVVYFLVSKSGCSFNSRVPKVHCYGAGHSRRRQAWGKPGVQHHFSGGFWNPAGLARHQQHWPEHLCRQVNILIM